MSITILRAIEFSSILHWAIKSLVLRTERTISKWSSVHLVSSLYFLLLSSDFLKSLFLLNMKSCYHIIDSVDISLSLVQITCLDVRVGDLGSIIFFHIEHVGVVEVFLYFSVLKFHLMNILPNLWHSPSQPIIHLPITLVRFDTDLNLLGRRTLIFQNRNIILNLFPFLPKHIQLTIQRIPNIEQILRLYNLCMNIIQLWL